ncbi:hypothetical protein CkaCkLH20_04517 [Colletotrichum karsti]|uniref:Uncharacterized protein n=1 Tax=Colletotrichum karsti TaxID=1095194 RepID=A0A9P6ICD1_9PEZI|nr:uncharacterized protein CkaCkLH20_04517 [Colletotrichum karsti]KAF9877941.1 hypothetical protein CkaCkLH20_04517 [Colletotrichum karsti]
MFHLSSSNVRQGTSGKRIKAKALNAHVLDSGAVGLKSITSYPGPLEKTGAPLPVFKGTNQSTTPILGRRRSSTLPNPSIETTPFYDGAEARETCVDLCPSASGRQPNRDTNRSAESVAVSGALSEGDEPSDRRSQASSVRQLSEFRTPKRKGKAHMHLGALQVGGERDIVQEFRSPGGWVSARKRPAERVLSPVSYHQGPERKRSVKRHVPKEQDHDEPQITEQRDPDVSHDPRGQESDLRSYASNTSDHVKTHHRPMGPIEKRRKIGLAQLENQREVKKERRSEEYEH